MNRTLVLFGSKTGNVTRMAYKVAKGTRQIADTGMHRYAHAARV